MTNLDITLSQFHLLLDHYLISKDLKNKFTPDGIDVLYNDLKEDEDITWTIETIVNEYAELSLDEFTKKFEVEKDKEVIEDYLYQEGSYLVGFTQDTVVFQDVLK